MKITISTVEARGILMNHFEHKLNASVDVEIEVPSPVAGANYIESICRVRLELPNYMTNQKIAAIKRLRELVPSLSLVDAKTAVEHPDNAITHYLKCGTFVGA